MSTLFNECWSVSHCILKSFRFFPFKPFTVSYRILLSLQRRLRLDLDSTYPMFRRKIIVDWELMTVWFVHTHSTVSTLKSKNYVCLAIVHTIIWSIAFSPQNYINVNNQHSSFLQTKNDNYFFLSRSCYKSRTGWSKESANDKMNWQIVAIMFILTLDACLFCLDLRVESSLMYGFSSMYWSCTSGLYRLSV